MRARPDTPVRLGIRGHSTYHAQLPSLAEGALAIPLSTFEKQSSESSSDMFEFDALVAKLGEKKSRIDIFRDGVRINDELPDTVYFGAEALERAEFKDPPRVNIESVEPSDGLPNGGWRISVSNLLPDSDPLGPLGFSAKLHLLKGDRLHSSEAKLSSFAFDAEHREHQWVLPAGNNLGSVTVQPDNELLIDTGALGWRGTVRLPGKGESVDTSVNPLEVWSLRETDYFRGGLYPLPHRK